MASLTSMQRPLTIVARLLIWHVWRRFGPIGERVRIADEHPRVTITMALVEAVAERRWNRLEPEFRDLVARVVNHQVGSFGLTRFRYSKASSDSGGWRQPSDDRGWHIKNPLDDRQLLVAEYAEAATMTPASVPESLVHRLRETFSEPEIVELGAWVALENCRSRFDAAMGLPSPDLAAESRRQSHEPVQRHAHVD